VTLIKGYDDAPICCSRCDDDYVESTARATSFGALGHHPGPLVSRRFVKGKNSAFEKRERSFRPAKPSFQLAPFSPERRRKNTALDFGERERRDEEIGDRLLLEPVKQSRRGFRLGCVANDVRIEEISRQTTENFFRLFSKVPSAKAMA